MKKLNIIAAAMVLVLSASCDRKIELQPETFATFDAVSFTVDETAGQASVPVSIYNPTGSEVKVTITAIDGSAVSGVDYEIISPASGILTFSGEKSTQNIDIKINGFVGEFTNNKEFTLQIASATDGISVGNLNTARVVIKDLDHPLSAIFGEYVASGTENWDGPISWPIIMDKDDNEVYAVQITNLINLGETLSGLVSEDMSTITIPIGQTFAYSSYLAIFVGYGEGGYYSPSGNIILTKTDTGWVQTSDLDDASMAWGYGCLAADPSSGALLGWLSGFYPGITYTMN